MLRILDRLLPDPPPPLVFELGEEHLTGVRRAGTAVEARVRRGLPDGAMQFAASKAEIVDADALRALIEEMLAELAPVPRPAAAVLLPDAAARVAVLDFDALPSKTDAVRSLIELRLKKTVPFNIGAARIGYQTQRARGGALSVLTAAAAEDTVRPLERLFAGLGLHLGFVSPSSSAMLNLVSPEEMTLVTRLCGGAMTMIAVDAAAVRLVRSVEAPAGRGESVEAALLELAADMYPTFAYIEDRFGAPAAKLLLAGFGEALEPAIACFAREFGCPVEALRSASGAAGAEDAGIQGYLHAA